MAFKQVVMDKFYLKIIHFLRELESEHGPITLGMMDAAYATGPARWNLSLAATWLDVMSQRTAIQLIQKKVKTFFGEGAPPFAATIVRRTNDSLVQALTSEFSVEELGTAYRIEGLEPMVFNMDEVIVFIANPAPKFTAVLA